MRFVPLILAASLAIASGASHGTPGLAPELTHADAGSWINSPPLTLAGLRALDDQEAVALPVPAATSADIQRLNAGVKRLRKLLQASDGDAADMAEELLPLARGLPLEGALKSAAEAIAAYDFDAALQKLAEV